VIHTQSFLEIRTILNCPRCARKERHSMNKQVIEFDGEAVGVVVPDAGRLKFVAVKYHVWDLDSRRFRSADEARAAVSRLMTARDIPDAPISLPAAAGGYAAA
jgi:hypothetical protein